MGFPKKRESATNAPDSAEPGTPRSVRWSPYDEGPRSRTPLWFALGGVAVLGALVGGLMFMWNVEGPDPTADAPDRQTTANVLPPVPQQKYGLTAERATDSEALTLKELFGKKKVTKSGRTYELTTRRTDKKCADAVVGATLQKALKSGKCTQVLRASFRDKAGKVIGTIGVANVKDTKAATKVAAAGGKGERQDYVKALPGKDDVTKSLGSGEAGAEIWVHGHYAVMIWFQFKDGHKPDAKGGKELSRAANDVAEMTVFAALDSRTLTGRPGV